MRRLRSPGLVPLLVLAVIALYATPLAALCACPGMDMDCCEAPRPAEPAGCCGSSAVDSGPALTAGPCHTVISDAPAEAAPPETAPDTAPAMVRIGTVDDDDTGADTFARTALPRTVPPPGPPLFLSQAVFRL